MPLEPKSEISRVISDLTTTKGCVACTSPIHNGSVIYVQPNIGLLSPEADMSCNPDGDILCLLEDGAAILFLISETDNPVSGIISTLHSPIIPQIVDASGYSAATITTLVTLWGFNCSWDVSASLRAKPCLFSIVL